MTIMRTVGVPEIHYSWIGSPTTMNGIAGHDTIGPIKMARANKTNKIYFWCLDQYQQAYQAIFKPHGIEVCSIEQYIQSDFNDTDIQKAAGNMQHMMKTVLAPDRNKVRDKASVKSLFSLFLLASKRNIYAVDSNLMPADENQPFALPANDMVMFPRLNGEPIHECWMIYAPPYATPRTLTMFNNFWHMWKDLQAEFLRTGYTEEHYIRSDEMIILAIEDVPGFPFSTWDTYFSDHYHFAAIPALGILKIYNNSQKWNRQAEEKELSAGSANLVAAFYDGFSAKDGVKKSPLLLSAAAKNLSFKKFVNLLEKLQTTWLDAAVSKSTETPESVLYDFPNVPSGIDKMLAVLYRLSAKKVNELLIEEDFRENIFLPYFAFDINFMKMAVLLNGLNDALLKTILTHPRYGSDIIETLACLMLHVPNWPQEKLLTRIFAITGQTLGLICREGQKVGKSISPRLFKLLSPYPLHEEKVAPISKTPDKYFVHASHYSFADEFTKNGHTIALLNVLAYQLTETDLQLSRDERVGFACFLKNPAESKEDELGIFNYNSDDVTPEIIAKCKSTHFACIMIMCDSPAARERARLYQKIIEDKYKLKFPIVFYQRALQRFKDYTLAMQQADEMLCARRPSLKNLHLHCRRRGDFIQDTVAEAATSAMLHK